ncbi:MAG: hypothetical protein HZC24_11470 [Rhodocyclales bacterium]|nr:hypothetical protein [Rhodocyclales bacterium]
MKSLTLAGALAAFAIAFGSGSAAHADGDHGKEPSREHSLRHGGDRDHQRWQRHWRPRIGATVFVGPVYRGPYVYTPYYFPPVVTLPLTPPPVYVEREAAAMPAPALTPSANYWYYCEKSAAYYPYVMECADGWKAVAPPPPG